ncbi:hypothetical protein HCUR_01351 [Holospora curviuscula]|uniref:Uncharacterized protein n=1 Tax=Holospora curviuscula TaxID=1082868 RepID=A0A2S5R795_9PROT|nr:hypothetical protein HCUR_01351 [Holospora curviuscula]
MDRTDERMSQRESSNVIAGDAVEVVIVNKL